MSVGKWIGGILGWVTMGPIGALIGYLIGTYFESATESADIGKGSARRAYSGTTGAERREGQRNSFLMSLMVLSTAVIKADGKVARAELDYVRNFIARNFSAQAASEAEGIIRQLLTRNIDVYEVCGQIRQYMNYSQRLQLFHYLADLAASDGDFCSQEKSLLETIASYLGLSAQDMQSILSMFGKAADSSYSILEIEPSATDDQVRKAYRRMALKYHPDKVATLGEDVRAAAEEKFKSVQAAYESIKKERGIK